MDHRNDQSSPKRKPSSPKPLRERREKSAPCRKPDQYPHQGPPKEKPKPGK